MVICSPLEAIRVDPPPNAKKGKKREASPFPEDSDYDEDDFNWNGDIKDESSEEMAPASTGGLEMDVVDVGGTESGFLCFTCGSAHEVRK